MRKRTKPIRKPCRTPDVTGFQQEEEPSMITQWCLFVR